MIIKSMARKSPSFKQLIEYMQKEKGESLLFNNLYANEKTKTDDLIKIFEDNSKLVPNRKNGNYLYHEMISFEKNNLEKEQLIPIFYDIAKLYIEERAQHNLTYCVIHHDTNNVHMHLCISANEIGTPKKTRLSKAKFSSIQKNIENYVLEQYPQLGQSKIYNKKRNREKLKTSSKEQEYVKRSKKLSYKEELKITLHRIFEEAQSHEKLIELLQKNNLDLYTRGEAVGVVNKDQNNRKHRLKTLGVLDHYSATNKRLENIYIKVQEPPPKTEPQKEPPKQAIFKAKVKEQLPEKKPVFKTKTTKSKEVEKPQITPSKQPQFKIKEIQPDQTIGKAHIKENQPKKKAHKQQKRSTPVMNTKPEQTKKNPSIWAKVKSILSPKKEEEPKQEKKKKKQIFRENREEKLDELDRVSKQHQQEKDKDR
jgi:hypothetical protein